MVQDDGLFWIRLFNTGMGIIVKDTTKNNLTFSERNGFLKTFKYKNWVFKILKPIKKFKRDKDLINYPYKREMNNTQSVVINEGIVDMLKSRIKNQDKKKKQ